MNLLYVFLLYSNILLVSGNETSTGNDADTARSLSTNCFTPRSEDYVVNLPGQPIPSELPPGNSQEIPEPISARSSSPMPRRPRTVSFASEVVFYGDEVLRNSMTLVRLYHNETENCLEHLRNRLEVETNQDDLERLRGAIEINIDMNEMTPEDGNPHNEEILSLISSRLAILHALPQEDALTQQLSPPTSPLFSPNVQVQQEFIRAEASRGAVTLIPTPSTRVTCAVCASVCLQQ